MRILVLNCGSSSLKFAVLDLASGVAPAASERRPRGTIERIGADATCHLVFADGRTEERSCQVRDHEAAVHYVFGRVGDALLRIDAVGHRVVHGGARFTATTLINPAVLSEIEALSELAPLHNPACAAGIRAARAACGDRMPMAAVFDTAFHHTLPDYAALYALPMDLAERHAIRRYGFHGIAHRFVAERYAQISGTPVKDARLITLHLGNGCSVTAVRGGVSVDTSMGFSPLEGLVMGTRCGDLDATVVAHLIRHAPATADTVERWLNHDSGLLGVSGRSNDMRELTANMDRDGRARLAFEMFCYRASKYVGAYLTVLGGADALIFSGGIGEHSASVRARICERLQWCGLRVDAERNAATIGMEGRISSAGPLHAWVIPADEELVIARETASRVATPQMSPPQATP